jgi:RNAse (barnase) inhibitor barstar
MAAFTELEADQQRLDWSILRDGGISLYLRKEILKEDIQQLKSYGYKIVEFNCAGWTSTDQMHSAFEDALLFPPYYGRNLDALNDCIREDINVPDTGGLSIVLRNADRCSQIRREFEQALSILTAAARHHMLFGHRFLTLVQVSNPRESFEHLGCIGAVWNNKEWLNKSRGL